LGGEGEGTVGPVGPVGPRGPAGPRGPGRGVGGGGGAKKKSPLKLNEKAFHRTEKTSAPLSGNTSTTVESYSMILFFVKK